MAAPVLGLAAVSYTHKESTAFTLIGDRRAALSVTRGEDYLFLPPSLTSRKYYLR